MSGGAKGSARLSPDRMAVRVRDSMALPLLPLAASICWQNRLRHKENCKRDVLSVKGDMLLSKRDVLKRDLFRDSMALPLLPFPASICWQTRLRHKENVKETYYPPEETCYQPKQTVNVYWCIHK